MEHIFGRMFLPLVLQRVVVKLVPGVLLSQKDKSNNSHPFVGFLSVGSTPTILSARHFLRTLSRNISDLKSNSKGTLVPRWYGLNELFTIFISSMSYSMLNRRHWWMRSYSGYFYCWKRRDTPVILSWASLVSKKQVLYTHSSVLQSLHQIFWLLFLHHRLTMLTADRRTLLTFCCKRLPGPELLHSSASSLSSTQDMTKMWRLSTEKIGCKE